MKFSSLKEEKSIVLIKETNDFEKINNFFMNNYWNKIGIFLKLMRKVSMRWKNWSDFKAQHSIHISRRKLVEDWHAIFELIGKIQDLKNEISYMNDSRDFQDAESVRSGQSHVTSQLVFFPPHPDPFWNAKPFSGNAELQQWAVIPEGMLRPSFISPRRKEGPPCIWDTHGLSGNVFANPTAPSSAPYPRESNPWSSNLTEHTSPLVMSERQTPVHDQRCQSRPSARNSVIPSEGRFSNNYGADQQRLQISDPHLWQIHHASNVRLLEDKIQDWRYVLVHNFLRKLCCGSKKWSWLIQWMI